MQIEKINENQLEVILDFNDLKQNNISIHSFMCNSSASQNLFLNILRFANSRIGFELKNHEIIIEAFSVPSKNTFVLVITRVPKVTYLHPSKAYNKKFKTNKSFWLEFDNFEEFCMFCNCLNCNLNIISSLYLLNNCYFLHIKITYIKDLMKILLKANEFASYIYNKDFILDENADIIIKNSAIETCRKYFV